MKWPTLDSEGYANISVLFTSEAALVKHCNVIKDMHFIWGNMHYGQYTVDGVPMGSRTTFAAS